MTEKNRNHGSYSSLQGIHRAVPIILAAVAVFTFFCFVVKDMGMLGNAISTVFLGLFASGAYALPVLLILHAFFYASDLKEKRIVSRVVFSLVTIIAISALAYAITNWNNELVFNAAQFFKDGRNAVGGGFIGSIVGFCIIKAFSKVGLIIITAAVFAIYISYFFAKGQKNVSRALFSVFKFIIILLAFIEDKIKTFIASIKKAKNEKMMREAEEKNQELTNDEFFGVDNGMHKLRISELGISETRSKEFSEMNPTLQEKVFLRSKVTPEEAEEMEMRDMAEELFYQPKTTTSDDVPALPKRRIINVTYGDGLGEETIIKPAVEATPVVEVEPEATTVAEEETTKTTSESQESADAAFSNTDLIKTRRTVLSDDRADAVFTHDFDPFSMIMCEELASKPSSRSLLDEQPKKTVIKEEITELTEESIKRARQIEAFERHKADFLSSRHATPVENDGEFVGTPKNLLFRELEDITPDQFEEDEVSLNHTVEKAPEAPTAEPANYTAIGFGDEDYTPTPYVRPQEFVIPETIFSSDSFDDEPMEPLFTRTIPSSSESTAGENVTHFDFSDAETFNSAYENLIPIYSDVPATIVFESPEYEGLVNTDDPFNTTAIIEEAAEEPTAELTPNEEQVIEVESEPVIEAVEEPVAEPVIEIAEEPIAEAIAEPTTEPIEEIEPEEIFTHTIIKAPAEAVVEETAPEVIEEAIIEEEVAEIIEEVPLYETPTVMIFETPEIKKAEPVAKKEEAPKVTQPEPAPVYQQPVYTQPQQPVYQAPVYAQPQQPVYQAPVYAQPQQPVYQQPVYAQPQQPVYQAPVYTQPQQPVYQAPSYTQPVASVPVAEPTTPVFEAPAAPVEEPAPTPAAPVFEEPVKAEEPEIVTEPTVVPELTYTATKEFGREEPTEEFVPEFKPYQPESAEQASSGTEMVFEFDTDDEPKAEPVNTLTIERSMISDDEITTAPAEDEFEITEEYDSFSDPDTDSFKDSFVDSDEDTEEEEALSPEAEEEIASEDDGWNTEEIPPEERNPVVQEYKNMFPVLDDNYEITDDEPEEEDHSQDYKLISPDEREDQDDSNPFDDGEDDNTPPFEVDPFDEEDDVEEEPAKPEKKKPDYSDYKMPPIELLGLDPQVDDDTSEINENTKILIDTLASFNVTASIKGVDRGPRITRYEVVPARGVKVNAITNLFNDIELNLAREGIRMQAPIPGKSAIGFEIPNRHPKNVRLRELLECEEFINASSKSFACIGKDVAGNPVFADVAKFPHALIAGATGMGKSVCINSIMISMLYKARPDEVKFIMIDPKKVEFKMYSGIPHLLIPVITEAKQAAGALMWAVEEMERRFDLIEKSNLRNIGAYNEKVESTPGFGEKLPKIVIVIDELNDLMMQVRDPVEDLIMRLAQKARAAGIHIIIGTQRPDVKVITGTIKANIPTRMSCKVSSVVDSRTILEMQGAEKLLDKGDMLFKPIDKPKPLRVQGAFVSDSEVENIMNFLKDQVKEAVYDEEIFAEINKAAQKCGNKKSGGATAEDFQDDDQECGYYSDQQFLDAVELAIRSKKISTSLLQRKLSIGYGKAAKYIDAMEEIGIVSEPKGQKPRDVLLTMDEWHDKLSRVNLD